LKSHSSSGSAIGLVSTLNRQKLNVLRIAPMETVITTMAADVMEFFQNDIVRLLLCHKILRNQVLFLFVKISEIRGKDLPEP